MPRGKVGFVDRVVGIMRDRLRVVLHRAPKVGDEMVLVVDGLDAGCVGPVEQHGARPEKRLDVVCDGTEPCPHVRRYACFSAEIGEGGLHSDTANRSAVTAGFAAGGGSTNKSLWRYAASIRLHAMSK